TGEDLPRPPTGDVDRQYRHRDSGGLLPHRRRERRETGGQPPEPDRVPAALGLRPGRASGLCGAAVTAYLGGSAPFLILTVLRSRRFGSAISAAARLAPER